ncbi:hypothetical protein FBQ82_19280, partial [Anaerolineae bacterium CFX7]|nr:hypothetical protein [Anaerolineae bacterium CFX7]
MEMAARAGFDSRRARVDGDDVTRTTRVFGARRRMMNPLPSGTVTLLFSDMEGSTRLLQALGERYAETLAAHHALLRACFEKHHGRIVDT